MAVTPFPKMMLAKGNCVWGDKGKMVAALPLISLVAAAPCGWHTPAAGTWSRTRTCGRTSLSSWQRIARQPTEVAQTLPSRIGQVLLVAAATAGSGASSLLSAPCYSCRQMLQNSFWNSFWLWNEAFHFVATVATVVSTENLSETAPSGGQRETEGKKPPKQSLCLEQKLWWERGSSECLGFKELDTRLPPTLWLWFWPHCQVLKRPSVLDMGEYGIV